MEIVKAIEIAEVGKAGVKTGFLEFESRVEKLSSLSKLLKALLIAFNQIKWSKKAIKAWLFWEYA